MEGTGDVLLKAPASITLDANTDATLNPLNVGSSDAAICSTRKESTGTVAIQ